MGARTLRALSLSTEAFVETDFGSAAYTWRGRWPFRYRRGDRAGVLVMRDRFDMAIVDEARRHGAVVHDGVPFEGLERTNGGITVRAAGRRFRTAMVIGADGVRSPVRRALGLGEVPYRGAAIEAEIPAAGGELRRIAHQIVFDFGGVPWGYGWIFPKQKHLSVGMLSFAPHRSDLRRCFERYLDREGLSGRVGTLHGWEIPAGGEAGRFHGDGGLLVGDAAGLVDPLTGEGIYYAVRSGLIAAQVVADGAPPEAYTRRIEREVVSELAVARRLASVFYNRPRLGYFAGVRSRRANAVMMDALMGKCSYADARRGLKRTWVVRLFS